MAQDILSQIPIDQIVNSTLAGLQPLLLKIGLAAGTIFVIYIIVVLLKLHAERRKVKLLEKILFDLDQLNIHFGAHHSGMRKTFLQRVHSKLFFHEK